MSLTAHASAEVIQALAATEGSALNFGRFSPESTGGEIRLSPDGVRSSTGSVSLSGGLYNPASFFLSGQPDFSIVVNLPTAPVLLTNTANGKTMTVLNWESIPAVSSSIKILSSGVLTLNVGATLRVGNMVDNPVGMYSGTYVVTFSYN
ncbi:MAG: hypothetical protein A2X19_10665 [Bacteroidetes bacterium GWE2_39_28]|nr:MAG: hypothetical protein A2X19_10665 [Bacteroidetes bacterium GWE2_39_28]OFY13540.1 MAG: hypothetical protein A2X16_07715 [Bacteroidetes bacterium GWF2_39_10]OFZ06645.1 MAG: hypothetical protein A2322_02135 [Bacteroidetes bacterium RIFOXYB2_FULL_39_7]OFZ11699.1 MAG: hypothetical protein A2465_05720 [Bacteroidetes bacterium RIFOXYC2_FULL_39_11]